MVTPLVDHDTLDVPGLERLVEHILSAGPAGLFILGTSGEGPSLSYNRRQELIERVTEQVAGRVPLLVGVTDSSFAETVNLAEFAADSGAQAVVAAPPFYFPCAQEDLAHYVRNLERELPLPVFLYNIPSLTKVAFELETVRRVMELPGIAGIKDSSGDMIYFHKLRHLTACRPDFSLLVGPEELLAGAVLAGAHGGVSGGANLHPGLYVALYDAASRRDLTQVEYLHSKVLQIASQIYAVAKDGPTVVKGLKCALSVLGICSDAMAQPFQPLDQNQRRVIQRLIDELGIPESRSGVESQ
jgi:4-hydroxy-tetrahydrodipicolinate synthase